MKKNTIKEKQSNKSSVRLLTILECLSNNSMPMKLQEIANVTNMSQSTVLRYLYSLKEENYIYQDDDTARYALTWKICQLSEGMNSFISLRNMANPFINQLANQLSLGACLVVEQNHECLYLDYIGAPNGLSPQRIGTIAPMHATGSGKVLLSQYSKTQFKKFLQKKGLPACTDHTITNPEKLTIELSKIRKQGFGMDEEECEIGLRCISLPLRDYTGKVIASMSVFGNIEEMNDTIIEQNIFPLLSTATKTISERLGFKE